MTLTKEQSWDYHRHTMGNREELERSQKCGCIACRSMFNAVAIEEYIREEGDRETALCPECGTDAVVGDASGLEISEEVLDALHDIWF